MPVGGAVHPGPLIGALPAPTGYAGGSPATRTGAALVSAALVGGIAVALALGLARGIVPPLPAPPGFVAIELEPPPSPPPPEPPPRSAEASAAKDRAGVRNRQNLATPVVAAPKRLPTPPPPVAAATSPASGTASQSGASPFPGPGDGAGSAGSGLGGGGLGGSGDGGGIATGPRQIRGRLVVGDFPDGLIGPGEQATVGVRYTVETDGRVSGCTITRSSGFSAVDTMACRLITARFRYRPAANRAGQPVRSVISETHTWYNRP